MSVIFLVYFRIIFKNEIRKIQFIFQYDTKKFFLDKIEIMCYNVVTIKNREEHTMKIYFDAIKKEIEKETGRGAWEKGVTAYALELLEGLEEAIDGGYFDPADLEAPKLVERALLNGADNWNQYSWGGCSLIYNGDIAERLCCPSELKKVRNGERRPNASEEWLDVQARALRQACRRVKLAVRVAQ